MLKILAINGVLLQTIILHMYQEMTFTTYKSRHNNTANKLKMLKCAHMLQFVSNP
jgi:hypothetical protein